MKKLLLSLVGVCLFFSCDNGNMNDENKNEQGYLTVSYHSEGHTSGEVPVDDNEYPITATGYTWEKDRFYPYEARDVPVSGRGTLERYGHTFQGWNVVDSAKPEEIIDDVDDFALSYYPDYSQRFLFMDKKSRHYEFHAIWREGFF